MGIPQKASPVLVVKHTFLEFVDRNIGVPRARFLTDSALEADDSFRHSASWPNALRSDIQMSRVEPEALDSHMSGFISASPSKPKLLRELITSPAPEESSPEEMAANQVIKSPTLSPNLRSPPMFPTLPPVLENPTLEGVSQPLSQNTADTIWQSSDGLWMPMYFMLSPVGVQTQAPVNPNAPSLDNSWQCMQASQFEKATGNQLIHIDQEQPLEQLQQPSQQHHCLQQLQQQQPRNQLQQHMQQQKQREQQQRYEKVPDQMHFDKLIHGAFEKHSPAPDQDDEGSGGIRTTVMLRNLPNSYTRNKLLELLDQEGFSGRYDFVYLPIDFSSKINLGYAFIDLISPVDADHFVQHFKGFSRWSSTSEKVCTVCWSNPHQGLQQHIERYRNSPVMHSAIPDEWKPIIIIDGARVAFPGPTKSIKAPKLRPSQRPPVAARCELTQH